MTDSKRRGRGYVVLLVLALAVLIVAGLASAFQVGVTTGMASAGAGIIAYQIPAMVFDWPRITASDILAFIEGVIDWIAGLFSF